MCTGENGGSPFSGYEVNDATEVEEDVAAGNRGHAADINCTELALSLSSRDLEVAACIRLEYMGKLHSQTFAVVYDTYHNVIIVLEAFFYDRCDIAVLHKETFAVCERNVVRVIFLVLFLETVIAIDPENCSVDIPAASAC